MGRVVAHALENGLSLHEIEVSQLQQFSVAIEADVVESLTLEGSIAARKHPGGTAPEAVMAAIQNAKESL